MTGLGTLVNMAAILIGSGIGLLLKNGIPKRLQTTISSAVGLCVVFVGVNRRYQRADERIRNYF